MSGIAQVVDARLEARERVGARFDARVLEPSPIGFTDPPWFADDPVNDAGPASDGPVLTPVPIPESASTWDEIARAEPDLASWCADRWLGAWRRLELPDDLDALGTTRRAWHVLAEHVLAPARHRANGKIGLRFTRAGFGTPFFGIEEQLRVASDEIVVVRDGGVTSHPITTVQAAAAVVGIEPGAPTDVYTPTTALALDAPLVIDAASASFLGDWFGFGASVLEQLRAVVPTADAPARVQLWPEHFDLSVDLGDESAGRRATFGASPGDDAHPEPYVYVSPWEHQTGAFWNEDTFGSLGFADLGAAADQRSAVLEYFDQARALLAS